MMKRHSWAKQVKGSQTIQKMMHSGRTRNMTVNNIKECQHCGLRRGTHKQGWNYSNTIYYDKYDKRWLSENKIPYTCNRRNDIFFKEDEFML